MASLTSSIPYMPRSFAAVDNSTTLDQLLQRLEQPRQWRGRRVRALRPLADDRALLSAINHGEFAINGFRNRHLRAIFFPQTTDDKKQLRRRSAWISRKLRLLRAHALITKITGTHRYQLTSAGRKAIIAILSALRSTVAPTHPCDCPTNSRGRIDAMKKSLQAENILRVSSTVRACACPHGWR